MFDDIHLEFDLSRAPSTSEFAKLAKAVLREEGVVSDRVGAHGFRRGRAVGLFHDKADRGLVSLALRHRSPQSADAYVLASARATVLASAMSPTPGRRGP